MQTLSMAHAVKNHRKKIPQLNTFWLCSATHALINSSHFCFRQVPFVFRSATNEILYMSHLDTVNARWSYDLLWAAGLYSTFDLFFAAIEEKTRGQLFNALMGALKQDPEKIKADAMMVSAYPSSLSIKMSIMY